MLRPSVGNSIEESADLLTHLSIGGRSRQGLERSPRLPVVE
jgi:hypothetical protein